MSPVSEQLSNSARRFKQLLVARGYDFEIVEMPDSTRTAQDAAQAVGCSVPQIAKSLVFKGGESGTAILAIVSGANRADTDKLAAVAGESIGKARADFVRAQTGYAIGGVPPTGHAQPLRTFIDTDLLQFEQIWAAAGTPRAVFCLPPSQLAALTGGTVTDIRVR